MVKIPQELKLILKKSNWFEGRCVELSHKLENEFGIYPPEYLSFMSEFYGLKIHSKGITEYISYSGKTKTRAYDHYIHFDLMYGEELMIDSEGEEGAIKYYSDIIGKQIYPIGIIQDDFIAAVDQNLTLYIFNTGILGCLKVHDNLYAGLECILNNDFYTTSYLLCENGDDKGKWLKR